MFRVSLLGLSHPEDTDTTVLKVCNCLPSDRALHHRRLVTSCYCDCQPVLFWRMTDCCIISSVSLYFFMTDYNCVDVLFKLVWTFVCFLRSKDCRKLWESSLHLSVNKRVPCSSWLSPWSSQVQRDACWNTCLATLWPHKLSLAITSWSYCASGNIHTCGWRNKVRYRTAVAECQLTRYRWHSQADCCRLFNRSVITWEICAEVMKQKVLEVIQGPYLIGQLLFVR
jgi:hypothetical protein